MLADFLNLDGFTPDTQALLRDRIAAAEAEMRAEETAGDRALAEDATGQDGDAVAAMTVYGDYESAMQRRYDGYEDFHFDGY